MRKVKPSILDRIDNAIDRFMEILEVVLPIWALIIFVSVIYQIVSR